MNQTELIEKNNKISNRLHEAYQEMREVKAQMVNAIHDMLSNMGAIKIDWDEDEDYPIISYDGGHHSEYASSLCASVNAIKPCFNKYDGKKSFSVDLEDENDYCENRMCFDDVAQIFEFVCCKYESYISDMEDAADDILHEFK